MTGFQANLGSFWEIRGSADARDDDAVKLQPWPFWLTGLRHGSDSRLHGCQLVAAARESRHPAAGSCILHIYRPPHHHVKFQLKFDLLLCSPFASKTPPITFIPHSKSFFETPFEPTVGRILILPRASITYPANATRHVAHHGSIPIPF